MQEFLINIQIEWPADISEEKVAQLSIDERALAAEYAKQGNLVRMWRVPGRRENWGLWKAKDTTQMHEIISSLPVWPYMNVTVHPLAKHPVDPQ